MKRTLHFSTMLRRGLLPGCAAAVLLLGSGCGIIDPCEQPEQESLKAEKKALQTEVDSLENAIAAQPFPSVSPSAQLRTTAAAAPTREKFLRLISGPPSPFP